jgi:hypothetical protein
MVTSLHVTSLLSRRSGPSGGSGGTRSRDHVRLALGRDTWDTRRNRSGLALDCRRCSRRSRSLEQSTAQHSTAQCARQRWSSLRIPCWCSSRCRCRCRCPTKTEFGSTRQLYNDDGERGDGGGGRQHTRTRERERDPGWDRRPLLGAVRQQLLTPRVTSLSINQWDRLGKMARPMRARVRPLLSAWTGGRGRETRSKRTRMLSLGYDRRGLDEEEERREIIGGQRWRTGSKKSSAHKRREN